MSYNEQLQRIVKKYEDAAFDRGGPLCAGDRPRNARRAHH